jgi:uncharacterized protein (TIGR02145 family)/uncharacterized repeat protein (TIGR02543 family)
MQKTYFVLFAVFILFLVRCGVAPDSPYDENSPNYVKPTITIDTAASSLKPNDTIHFNSAMLVLIGNKAESRFQVKVDSMQWSSWEPAGTFPLTLLSDGKHTAYINTKYADRTKTWEDSIVFFVQVQGFRPLFSPLADTVVSIDTGTAINFSVSAEGLAPLTYQWYQGLSLLRGKIDTSISLSSFAQKDTGAYRCIVSNNFGSDTSRVFSIKFRPVKGGIKGFLISSKNSGKLEGVVVRLSPGNAIDTSNSEGFFEFNRLLTGTYSVAIALSGYQDYAKPSIEVNDSTIKDLGVIVLIVNDTGTIYHKVDYDGNGSIGGSIPVDQNSYKSGATVIVLGNTGHLVKTSGDFTSWNSRADGSGKSYVPGDTIIMGTSNVTLFAKWKTLGTLRLTYADSGKTGGFAPTDTNKYAAGDSVLVLGNSGNLAKTGYSFAGWNTKPDGSGTNYNAGSKFPMPSSSATLYPKWTNKPTYSLTYNKNGADSGSVPAEGSYEAGATVTVSDNTGKLAKIGYAFSGWNTLSNGAGTSYAPGATLTKSATNDTFFAKWNNAAYTVKFNSQGGSAIDSQKVNYGDKITKPAADPTWAGHIFGGWYKESGCTNAWNFTNATVTADMTLFAKWTTAAYTVKFNSQGGSAVDSQKVTYGDKVVKPADPALTGSTFVGWYKESGCTNVWDFTNATVAADMTLFAKWSQVPVFAISFNKNDAGASGTMTDQHIASGGSANLTANAFTKTGWSFAGWSTTAGGVVEFADQAIFTMGAANASLYAKWTANPYTITFDKNDAGASGAMSTQTILCGSSANLIANAFIKPGWAFAGWATTAGGAVAFANQASYPMGTADVTLYAKWTANSLTITFDKNDAGATGSMSTQAIASGSSANLIANAFNKTGWSFAGWATTAGGVVAFANQASYPMGTADVTLFAKWTLNSYTITFDKNDVSASGTMATQSIPYNTSAYLTANAFNKTGWSFAGWAITPSDAPSIANQANYIMGAANVTLYAKWTMNVPVITTQLKNDSCPVNASVTFTVVANGADLSYAWQKNGNPIGGATGSNYTPPALTAADISAAATYKCIVSNTAGNAQSSATLSVATASDVDANVYHQVKIGTQIWMMENLRVTKYNDGSWTGLQYETDDASWMGLTGPGYCWYNNQPSNKDTHGALYNWYVGNQANPKKIAPVGWHVPSDAEWTQLTNYLGGELLAGGKLKEAGTAHWVSPNQGATNETGFTALPSGVRFDYDGTFGNEGQNSNWWSSTQKDATSGLDRLMYATGADVWSNPAGNAKVSGFSIRCIHD